MGIPSKKITKTNAGSGFAYKYEVNLFENIEESEEEYVNESGIIKIGNAIENDLKDFLINVVISKSKGYVRSERDAAALLLDIIKHRYNF